MASLRVEFVQDGSALEISAPPEVHDVTIPDDTVGAPPVLENPHVDFPGRWVLQGEGEGGTFRYVREDLVADTMDTTAVE